MPGGESHGIEQTTCRATIFISDAFPQLLSDGLKCIETGATYGRTDANTTDPAMNDSGRHLLTRAQKSGFHICLPHFVKAVRDDRPIMCTRAMICPVARLGAQAIPAHQPQNPRL